MARITLREQLPVDPGPPVRNEAVVTLEPYRALLSPFLQGHDEETLESILRCGVPCVGLVASPTRGAAVSAMLEERGVLAVATIRSPAGLDLGARTPHEVALSILAEIIQARPSGARVLASTPSAASPVPGPDTSATAVDPVCGMSVTIASARQKAEVDGVRYYFCCANCRTTFLTDSPAYLAHP